MLQACDQCRARKLKCDGQPQCSRCTRRNTQCHYRTTMLKRGPPKGSASSLVRKLRRLEAAL
ncbi:hypothetical protein M427DRAFT_102537, partial [Gonapodya prolifera JEL478]